MRRLCHASTGTAISARAKIPADKVEEVLKRVRERHHAVGYEGNYREWIAKVTPADLQ